MVVIKMKFLLLSDIHGTSNIPRARRDNVLLAVERKLEYVFKYAASIDADIIQAGDLSNSPRDIQFLFKFISIRMKYQSVEFYTIWGQHDQYNRNKNVPTNLGILSKSNLVKIISSNSISFDAVDLYGASWNKKIPEIQNEKKVNILCIHAPITKKQLWPNQVFTQANSVFEKKEYRKYDLIICGDIHRHFVVKQGKQIICNTGPMLRLEATNYCMKHKPKFYVYDTFKKTFETKIIPHADPAQVMNNKHLEVIENNDSLGNIYLNSKQLEEVNIMKIIENLIVKSGKENRLKQILQEIGSEI